MKAVVSLLVVVALTIMVGVAARVQADQAPAAQQAGGLRLIVIEGEAAVNVIQQGTAVAPVVEVRDRNDLPVAGATVQFVILRTGNAAAATFANGQTTVNVTTNAAGRAAASQLQAVGRGAVRIQVQASYQGQVATTTVTQTNVATQAEASRVSRAGQSGGSGAVGGVAATASAIAGGAAAVIGGVTAVQHARKEPSCQANGDRALAAITLLADSCPPGSTSASCTQTGADATTSLGDWCSCAGGRPQLEVELNARGTTVPQLQLEAARRSVTFPSACS